MPVEDGWKNLTPFGSDESTADRDKAIRQKGAAAAREIKRKRKALRDILDELLALPACNDILADSNLVVAAVEAAGERGELLSAYDAISLAQIVKAGRGDTDAARWIRDSAGDKPTEKQQIVADVVTPADAEIAKRVAERLDKAKQNSE